MAASWGKGGGGGGGGGVVAARKQANSVIIAVSHCVEFGRGVEVTARQSTEGSRAGCLQRV